MITDDDFHAFLRCKTKWYRRSSGVPGGQCEFAEMQCRILEEYTHESHSRLLSHFQGEECLEGLPLEEVRAHKPCRIAVNCMVQAEELQSRLHAVEIVPSTGRKQLLAFVPVRFVPTEKITKHDKLMLAFDALALSLAFGTRPNFGRIIHGAEHRSSKVQLTDLMKTARSEVRQIRAEQESQTPPPVFLNKHCAECEYQPQCRRAAVEEDDLSLLSGMTGKERKILHNKGIFTVTQLSYTFRPRSRPKRLASKPERYHHSLKALAIRENKIHICGRPELNLTGNPVYLDVEKVPDRDFYYLIGLRAINEGSPIQHSFWADDAAQEEGIWTSFNDALALIENPQIIHYGSYESVFLKRMKKRYPEVSHTYASLGQVVGEAMNLLSVIYAQVYFPTYSNGLKEIAHFLGVQWTDSEPSGLKALAWRHEWEYRREPELKQKLVRYNAEDCEALEMVAKTLSAIERGTSESASADMSIIHTDSLRRQGLHKWGRTNFSLPAFDYINRCAYWDYQRDRLRLRPSIPNRRGKKPTGKRATVTYPINKVIKPSRPVQCLHCGSPRIVRYGSHTKPSYDVRFGRAGVRRWVQKFVVHHYKCLNCGKTFPSDRHGATRHPYGTELIAYVVYHVVELGIPQAVLARQISTVFHYNVGQPVIHKLLVRAADFYTETYEAINRKIVCGDVLHADETTTSIKGERAYVWVFTSLREVLYVYSETREATVLSQHIEGFKGVLVSDFYAAYDSMECPQQKCLVHLMRDLNDDLLSHPFDEELRSFAQDFGGVLRPIVETIDRFGLKERYLRKHKREAQRFLVSISRCEYKTEAAISYQKRFQKNADKLFTFLDHDGVAWNNNNAEHAIKAFARLRNVIGGSCTEQAIRKYLVLLSVCETCEYKGVTFLDFLRSGEKDVDVFVQKKTRRSRRTALLRGKVIRSHSLTARSMG
jgi:predicted RecB family nuclease